MKDFANSLVNLWSQLGLNQRVSLIVSAVAVTGGVIALLMWSSRPDFQLLYGRLSEKDTSSIVAMLQERNTPHQLGAGGQSVYVPADRVHALRMELAGKGLPAGDGVGFEILIEVSLASATLCNAQITIVRYRGSLPGQYHNSTACNTLGC